MSSDRYCANIFPIDLCRGWRKSSGQTRVESIGESCSHKVHEGCARAALTTQARLPPSERSYSSIRINSDRSGAGHLELLERAAAGDMGGLEVSNRPVKFTRRYSDSASASRLRMPMLRECVPSGGSAPTADPRV